MRKQQMDSCLQGLHAWPQLILTFVVVLSKLWAWPSVQLNKFSFNPVHWVFQTPEGSIGLFHHFRHVPDGRFATRTEHTEVLGCLQIPFGKIAPKMASDLCNKLWTMVKLLLFSRKSQADWNSLQIFNLSLFAPLEFWNNDVMVMLTLWIQFMICCMLGWKHSHLSIHFSWSIGMLTSTQPPKVPNRPAPAQKVVLCFFSWKLYIIVWGQMHRGTVCLVIDIAVFPFILQILQLSWLGAEYMMKTWLGWPFQWRLRRKRPSVGSSETEKAENSKNSPFGLDVDTFNEHI